MREYTKNLESRAGSIDSNPSAFKQSSIGEILLQYKERNTRRDENEKLIQGKSDTAQIEITEGDEFLHGKFESTASTEQNRVYRESKPNNTGLPNDLKSGIENLSGYSLDDIKVHYNSDKPAQLNALAYAQGTDIHIAPGQEKHLPHETWHVVQQKQGRVLHTIQLKDHENVNDDAVLEKEADIMSGIALSGVDEKINETFKAAPSSKNVLQRKIKVNRQVVLVDDILTEDNKAIQWEELLTGVRGNLKGWLTYKDGLTGNKANMYFTKRLGPQIRPLLAKYDNENRTFDNNDDLMFQLIQDVKLIDLGFSQMMNVDALNTLYALDGQFTRETDNLSANTIRNRGKNLRIYRTTTLGNWNKYDERINNVGVLLEGHGGSLGQALYYFQIENKRNARVVLLELTLERSAVTTIDYTQVNDQGEGRGANGGRLTGKPERNNILKDSVLEIFSVNLGPRSSKDLIAEWNPRVSARLILSSVSQ